MQLKKIYMIVKVDGDGQHDLSILSKFINEILNNDIDLCKVIGIYLEKI